MKTLFLIMALTLVACGPQGYQGIQGVPGPVGPNGHSSLIKQVANDSNCQAGGTLVLTGLDTNDNGVLDLSEVQYSADVCNGTNGINGQSPAFTPTIAITPCGPTSATFKEAMLGMFGGGVFTEFTGNASDASTVANILLPDGSWYDTDSSQCNFTSSTDGSGNRSIVWNGSSHNGSGPYHAGHADYNAATKTWTAVY